MDRDGHAIDVTRDIPMNVLTSQQNQDIHSNNVSDSVAQHGCGYWIWIKLFISLSQIITAIVVLSLSRYQAPLYTWVLGYVFASVATIPGLVSPLLSNRLKVFVQYIRVVSDYFFLAWIVVGSFWIFGSHSFASDAPNLYWLFLAFLTFRWVVYVITPSFVNVAIRFIFWFTPQIRGAPTEIINSLPTYTFNNNNESLSGGDGEDAVCSICLSNYANNKQLTELPCTHLFHKDCVGDWLKINASCPLCKIEVRKNDLSSTTAVGGGGGLVSVSGNVV